MNDADLGIERVRKTTDVAAAASVPSSETLRKQNHNRKLIDKHKSCADHTKKSTNLDKSFVNNFRDLQFIVRSDLREVRIIRKSVSKS